FETYIKETQQTSISPHVSDLRDLFRQRESLLSQMTALKCDMKRILTITFPELEKLTGVFTTSTWIFKISMQAFIGKSFVTNS
ncbi:MAG: hypothetical protein NTY16_10215, partial [Deltaproteobacteria bacterium]|nr:hypothetical protein [Deltaproteobacteria bacterium]